MKLNLNRKGDNPQNDDGSVGSQKVGYQRTIAELGTSCLWDRGGFVTGEQFSKDRVAAIKRLSIKRWSWKAKKTCGGGPKEMGLFKVLN